MTNEALIEELARAICDYVAQHDWDDLAEDRIDLRMRMRSGGNYDVNEPNKMDLLDAARAILPIIQRECLAAGEAVKEAAIQKSYARCPSWTGAKTIGDLLRSDIRALNVEAIVGGGE